MGNDILLTMPETVRASPSPANVHTLPNNTPVTETPTTAAVSAIVASPTVTVQGDLIANAYWSATFDLTEQQQLSTGGSGAGFSGDSFSGGGSWVADSEPELGADQITSDANYSGGLGGRGFRHKVGNDYVHSNGGGVNLIFSIIAGTTYLP